MEMKGHGKMHSQSSGAHSLAGEKDGWRDEKTGCRQKSRSMQPEDRLAKVHMVMMERDLVGN